MRAMNRGIKMSGQATGFWKAARDRYLWNWTSTTLTMSALSTCVAKGGKWHQPIYYAVARKTVAETEVRREWPNVKGGQMTSYSPCIIRVKSECRQHGWGPSTAEAAGGGVKRPYLQRRQKSLTTIRSELLSAAAAAIEMTDSETVINWNLSS